MTRNHNINEDYQHYQYRTHNEKYMISKIMGYLGIIVSIILLLIAVFDDSKKELAVVSVFVFIVSLFFIANSLFNKFRRWWTSR